MAVTGDVGISNIIGIPAFLQSEFSLTPAGTKTPGRLRVRPQADLASGVIAPLRDLLSDQSLKVGVIVPKSLAMFRVA